MKEKEFFFNKYEKEISRDKNFIFSFMKRIARNWAVLGEKRLALKYFLKALSLKPYKIELVGQIMKTL
jgi:hypothetical protein